MTNSERRIKLVSFGNGYDQLITALNSVPREVWDFKPSPGQWSIHEIIIHIVDAEVKGCIRFRKGIAEAGKPIMVFDQEQWARSLYYQGQHIDSVLELIRLLRLKTYHLIERLPGQHHSTSRKRYADNGDFLKGYKGHIASHIKQIQKNHELWALR